MFGRIFGNYRFNGPSSKNESRLVTFTFQNVFHILARRPNTSDEIIQERQTVADTILVHCLDILIEINPN